MNFEYIEEFIYLAEKLNFTETANKFYITQPTLSKHLSCIEKNLGIKLMIRNTHHVYLTQEGSIVYNKFKEIMKHYNQIQPLLKNSQQEIYGTLTIGMLYYAVEEYIEPIVPIFSRVYSNVSVDIKSCQNYEAFQQLNNNVIDIGVVMGKDSLLPSDYSYNFIKLEKYKAMMISNHPLASKSSLSLSDIENEVFLILKKDKEYTDSLISDLNKNNIYPKTILPVEQLDIIPMELKKSKGIFLCPESLKNMNIKNMVLKDIDTNNMYCGVYYAYKKSNLNPCIPLFLNTWHSNVIS